MSIGDRLRAERQKLRLSQTAFAELGGVGKTTQVLYESGQRVPDANYLAAVAAHGVDVLFVVIGQRGARDAGSDLDLEVLESVVEAVDSWAAKRGKPTQSSVKADLIRLFYKQFQRAGEVDSKLMEDHLRHVA